MDFVYNAEDGESLPILQVHSWGREPLNLSEFKEACVSPMRDLLLLLSYQCEALLLPLVRSDLPERFSSFALPSPLAYPSQPASPSHSSFFKLPVSSPPASLASKSVEPQFYTPPTSQRTTFGGPHSVLKSTSEAMETPKLTPFSTPFWSPFSNTSSIHEPSTDTSYETPQRGHLHGEYPMGVGKNSSCSISDAFPSLSDVRSVAWGCCGDESGATKHGLLFKELLFVSGNGSLTVHAFCGMEVKNGMTNEESNATREEPERGPVEGGEEAGRLVSWGPAGVFLEDRFTDVGQIREESNGGSQCPESFNEVVNLTGELGERGDRINGERMDGKDPIECSTSKKWLQSFLMDIDIEESGGNLLAKFPVKSSIPSSVEVVSFCISFSSPAFMRFACSRGEAALFANDESSAPSTSIKEEKAGKVTNLVLDADSVQQHHSYSKSSERFSIAEQFEQDRGDDINIGYECSKLFSSPSHRLVGMVLKGHIAVSEAVEKEHPKSTDELFVLVAMIHEWGIRWVCSVDLQKSARSPMLETCWSAFQLADEVLLGLKESGIIFMWTATTGKFMACIDVLCHSQLELNLQFQKKGESKPPMFLHNDEIKSSIIGRVNKESIYESGGKSDDVHMSGKVRPGCCFTKLLVTANCLLIAVTDKHGSVYVISTDEYFANFKLLSENSTSLPKYFSCCDLNILSSWHVAGSDIGGQKLCSTVPSCHWLKSFADTREVSVGRGQTERITLRNKRELSMKTGGTQASADSSGFLSSSQRRSGLISSRGKVLQPMRRVFLPSEQADSGAIISLSPYGITKVVNTVNSDICQKEFKIVQTPLRIPGIMHGDQDLDADLLFTKCRPEAYKKERRFLGEAIGCCSQGCLYLVSQSGLHVVLPPLSFSSSVAQGECQGQWWFTGINSEDFSTRYESLLPMVNKRSLCQQWQLEILDRALVYDDPDEAEHLSVENDPQLLVNELFCIYLRTWLVTLPKCRWMSLDVRLVQDETSNALV